MASDRAQRERERGVARNRRRAAVAALLALAGCNQTPDTGPVVVSAIGARPAIATARAPWSAPTRLLVGATAQGLVSFDAGGQVEAGLAERWTVVDDGTTYIFRLRAATWDDGTPVTAPQVADLLRRSLGPASRNPLAPFLTAIGTVAVMTPQVIELRLRRPRPDLLKLFAQAELGLWRPAPAGGSGPFRVAAAGPAALLLRPVADPARADPDDPRPHRPEDEVRLTGERAAIAIARFAARRSDLVAGGTFADWPLLATAADLAPASVRVDPAAGLFGLAIVARDGFLADPARRAALAAAIDAGAVTAAVSPGWSPVDAILPEGGDSSAPPARPAWTLLPLDDRVAAARDVVRAWRDTPGGGPVTLRIAMPAGPGATLVFGAVAAGLLRIGVGATRVGPDEAADLRLVDRVAPYDSARWYLATACQLCGAGVQAALEAAREAPTLAERTLRIAAADQALVEDVAFIPLARPLRWSLVSARLSQWQPNARAVHPLNHLRPEAM